MSYIFFVALALFFMSPMLLLPLRHARKMWVAHQKRRAYQDLHSSHEHRRELKW